VANIQWEKVSQFDHSIQLLAAGSHPNGLALYINLWPFLDDSIGPFQSLDGGQTWQLLNLP